MLAAADRTDASTAIQTDLPAIFASLELNRSTWLITSLSPGTGEKMSKHSKAGNPRLRTTMIQLAWLWLRHQPTSALSVWFQQRVQSNGSKMRKTMIVALARKLLVALWRYSTSGVVIEGAVMKTI